ncbi:hypothetical protein EDB19DRAFT_1912290 [Suillus lakei]|nr:hypothetical protein EDB19DRAFT_1912290 [Suillus lakei]
MAWRAPDNLRFYIQEARLVSISLSSSQPSVDAALHALPRRYRKLRGIHPLRLALFNEYCQDWTEDFVPCVSLGEEDEDKETGEALHGALPTFLSSSVYQSSPGLIASSDLLPLETVRRAVHLLYPETKTWSFASDADDPDHSIFKCITWSQLVDHDDERHCRSAMSIFIQPPWVLSSRDLELFCKRQSVWAASNIEAFAANVYHQFSGSSSTPWHERPTTPHERLWYKLWDCCITRSCPWFVVSTYTHWVFGVFSSGWTAAVVSPAYSHDSHEPSVLQLLLFWLCSAMGLPGGWVVPETTARSTFALWAGDD